MSQYTSYYLYQRYEKRGDQAFIPSFPNVYSVDGEGTMPAIKKEENDTECGYVPAPDPIYRWVQMPIEEDYVCDDCGYVPPTAETQFRWVATTGYMCNSTTKYNKEKQQASTDGGINWVDTGIYRAGSTIIEQQSTDCGYVPPTPVPTQYRWVTVSGEYECSGTTKVNKEKQQSSTDSGVTWTDTGVYRAGSTVIETGSTDCGYSPEVIYRWLNTEGYMCDTTTYTKYNREMEQVSTDGGVHWTSTGNYRAGSIVIETESPDCGYIAPQYRWVTTDGYYCNSTTKYNREKQQVSYDSGVTWTDTGVYRAGSTVIETGSTDCGYIEPQYRWVTTDGYYCSGTTKYNREKQQTSTDGGVTWTDTGSYRAGSTVIETESIDCGYVPPVPEQYRWVTVAGEYECSGTTKVNREKQQVSIDGGFTWTDTGVYRAGSTVIETGSTDCGYIEPQYRWVTTDGYYCSGTTKYNREKQQVSTDGGVTWTDTGSYRAGSTVIETESADCGYVPPQYRWVATEDYVCIGESTDTVTRWVVVDGEYVCEYQCKFTKEKEQTTSNGGITWVDTGNYRRGNTVLDPNSTDCGYQA